MGKVRWLTMWEALTRCQDTTPWLLLTLGCQLKWIYMCSNYSFMYVLNDIFSRNCTRDCLYWPFVNTNQMWWLTIYVAPLLRKCRVMCLFCHWQVCGELMYMQNHSFCEKGECPVMSIRLTSFLILSSLLTNFSKLRANWLTCLPTLHHHPCCHWHAKLIWCSLYPQVGQPF